MSVLSGLARRFGFASFNLLYNVCFDVLRVGSDARASAAKIQDVVGGQAMKVEPHQLPSREQLGSKRRQLVKLGFLTGRAVRCVPQRVGFGRC